MTPEQRERADETRAKQERLVLQAITYSESFYFEGDWLHLVGGRAEEFSQKILPLNQFGLAALLLQDIDLRNRSTATLHQLVDRLERREGDVLYDAGSPFRGFECGPKKITIAGAGPGAGKTAMAMQFVFQLLENDPKVRVFLANAETDFEKLLEREITRRSGVPARAIRFADLTDEQFNEIKAAADQIEPLCKRIESMQPPFTLDSLEKQCGEDPGLLVLDYLQKFSPGDDPRLGTNTVMAELRHMASQGWGVLALSSTTRAKSKNGTGHDAANLSMASFKESGEIEFNADAAYLVKNHGPVDQDDPYVDRVVLDCVKNRHGVCQKHELIFDKPRMAFERPLVGDASPFEEFADWSESAFA
ncbi:replicative DNA helicase [Crateriforma conspicua]|uniref:Replicative DNA helicase n=2 Tax=Crateriforma conspicua TaxID=2527996 RepID=A0A5C5Y2B7_9PLAN|nr:replicative DNA helicase [Crateriforma conspicua]